MKNAEIAAALRSADWSNTSIGNKAVILAAINALDPPGFVGNLKDILKPVPQWEADAVQPYL